MIGGLKFMKPVSSGGRRKWRSRLVVISILVIIIIAVGAFLFFSLGSSESPSKPYFSKVTLEDKEIREGEITLLKVRVRNPGENTYENNKIQLVSFSPKVKMQFTNENVTQVGDEYRLTVPIRDLRPEMGTYSYTFDVGGSLYPGVVSMTVRIEVRVLSDGDILDKRVFDLKIRSKSSD